LLVENDDVEGLRQYLRDHGVVCVEIDVNEAASTLDVIGALKNVLLFPSWCGSSWDSIDDAFDDIRAGWSFPLAVVVHGLRSLFERDPHLALEVALRLHELANAFSAAGEQFLAVFASESWH
jgi:hypothetical protein